MPNGDPRMVPLFERGTAALRAFIDSLPPEGQPLGGSAIAAKQVKYVITRADFITHSDLCFDHVMQTGSLIHVLCTSGAICAILDKRIAKW